MSILSEILETKAEELRAAKASKPLGNLRELAESAPAPREFARRLQTAARPAVIAEIKRASPSKGLIRQGLDPVLTASEFTESGAACLSVLTDEKYFQGKLDFIRTIRKSVPDIAILRKDFIIDPYQVWETRVAGADALLLIVSALEQSLLQVLLTETEAAGLNALIEVHNEPEAERALLALQNVLAERGALPEVVIGINNRDLHTFTTDIDVTKRLVPKIRAKLSSLELEPSTGQLAIISESGIMTPADIIDLSQCGVDGFLIGESLVAEGSPGENLRTLINSVRSHKS